MKTISGGLKTHLAGVVTTLATCWLLVRTDGTTYSFTAFDEDLVVDAVTYLSTAGFSRSAINTGSTGEVDNLEVVGFFGGSGIAEEDLKNGLFDYATIYLFAVNWANISQGICRLRRGWLGECIRAPNGSFMAELRGLTQALVQEFGNVYQPLCRADLGDAKCKIPILPAAWAASQAVIAGQYVQALTRGSDALKVAIFQAAAAGTTGSSEPTWNTTIGTTTADNGITWTSRPYWRGIAAVTGTVDQHNFISSALSLPAAAVTASNVRLVSFRNNVSGGTEITVTDGVTSTAWTTPGTWDITGGEAADLLFIQLQASGLDMTFTLDSTGLNVGLFNNSGQVGDITKTGDTAGGIAISNFATPILDGGSVTWITGENAGASMELKTYNAGTNQITLWLGMGFPIQVGDTFFFYAGCDKRRDTCLNTFANILNFRGEPDMPGTDALLSYPDQ